MIFLVLAGLIVGFIVGYFIACLKDSAYKIGYLRVDHTDYDIYHTPNFYMEIHDAETVMNLKDGQEITLEVKCEDLSL